MPRGEASRSFCGDRTDWRRIPERMARPKAGLRLRHRLWLRHHAHSQLGARHVVLYAGGVVPTDVCDRGVASEDIQLHRRNHRADALLVEDAALLGRVRRQPRGVQDERRAEAHRLQAHVDVAMRHIEEVFAVFAWRGVLAQDRPACGWDAGSEREVVRSAYEQLAPHECREVGEELDCRAVAVDSLGAIQRVWDGGPANGLV
mmetsp:Transcript_10973/g.23273  ORF Transcript_10973/g.23273 Transcript_10973/m.23273 type:complete len:203 (-) Transcript_10973:83-691(-)